MRLGRRAVLAGGGALAAACLAGAALDRKPDGLDRPVPVPVAAVPMDRLSEAEPDRTRFGSLAFRSGLELSAREGAFGGFSALWRSPDGGRLAALGDHAHWLSAGLRRDGGRLTGIMDAVMHPLRLEGGKLLRRTRFSDTESLAVTEGGVFVGAERRPAVLRFLWDGQGEWRDGQPIPAPRSLRKLPSNRGLEALGVAPPASPLAGALIAVAERSGEGEDSSTAGYIARGEMWDGFQVRRLGGYDVADLAFLPSGDMLLLERRFSLFGGFATRLRRVAAEALRPGALVDGPVLYESEPSHRTDNMEGLCVHREREETVLTLISDDNFNPFQRTLLLEFALIG